MAAGAAGVAVLSHAELVALVLKLVPRIEALEARGRGPRDAADEALLLALRELVGLGTFTTADMIERARLDAVWRERLEAADVQTVADAGYLLRRCHGWRGLSGVGKTADGVVWQFVDVGDDPSSIVIPDDDGPL
jgi:hypothetical protein